MPVPQVTSLDWLMFGESFAAKGCRVALLALAVCAIFAGFELAGLDFIQAAH